MSETTAVEERGPKTLRFLDPKFRRNYLRYIAQCIAATVFIFVVLVVLNVLTQTVLIASLGATAFISFTMPHVESSKPRYLIGGYAVGVVVGVVVSVLVGWIQIELGVDMDRLVVVSGAAIATGLAMFLMVVTDTEHPPAAAVALGFVLNSWDLRAIVVVVLVGVSCISMLKEAYKHRMMNLL